MNNPNPRLNLPRRRLLVALLAVCIGALASILAMSSQALASSGGNPFEGSGQLVPQIINGKESSISEFPWQVWVLLRNVEGEATCGGSILNSTTILTAAHCTDHDGTTTPYTPTSTPPVTANEAEIFVVSGISKGLGFPSSGEFHPEPLENGQAILVKSVRRDPYYAVSPEIKDDVAVLTLEKELKIEPAKDTATIPLVGAGDTPAPGTTLSISGYGKEEGKEGVNSNGKLYSTTLTAISSDACRAGVGLNSAVLLCAGSATSSTCQGDSGGPLTEGSPAVQVGIVDFGAKECPVGVPDVFTNIAAPEIRDFIEGSEAPPVAARPTSPPVLKPAGATPVDFSPLTCEPGAWNGSPTFTYTIQEESSSSTAALQSGPGNIFTPPSSLVGAPLICIVQASNPGGVTTARSATTPAIAADTAPPATKLGALTCKLQACTLAFTATDPNGVALSEQASAAYSVVTKCPKKKKKKKSKKPVKQPVCHKTQTVPMALSAGAAGAFQAAVSRLPYSETITFIVDISNAAALQATPLSTHTTLHKPKPKKKSKKPKKRK
jgi:secreted trypsin-like serine protease